MGCVRRALCQCCSVLRHLLLRPDDGLLVFPTSGHPRDCHLTCASKADGQGAPKNTNTVGACRRTCSSRFRTSRKRYISMPIFGRDWLSFCNIGHRSIKTNYIMISAVRDEEQYIESTLRSMVAQSILPQEWVVVDDGSRDRTGAIVQRYADQYSWIRLVQR